LPQYKFVKATFSLMLNHEGSECKPRGKGVLPCGTNNNTHKESKRMFVEVTSPRILKYDPDAFESQEIRGASWSDVSVWKVIQMPLQRFGVRNMLPALGRVRVFAVSMIYSKHFPLTKTLFRPSAKSVTGRNDPMSLYGICARFLSTTIELNSANGFEATCSTIWGFRQSNEQASREQAYEKKNLMFSDDFEYGK
jgi:hypothetical protein